MSAAIDAHGTPISMGAQAEASSIHSATTVKNARQHLNVHEPACLAAINPLDPNAPPKQRMPAVVNNKILPDMARMDG